MADQKGPQKPSSRAAKKNETKARMAALVGNITAHTQSIATRGSTELDGTESGVMFLDNSVTEETKDELVYLHPKDCYVEKQVREKIDQEKVVERRHSMEAHGQIKPITVMPRDEKGYKVVTGEYRYRAASIDPPMMLAAIIKRTDRTIEAHKIILKQLAENTEAVPVNIFEIAVTLRRAMEAGKMDSHVELAKQMGWHDPERPDYGRVKVSQYLSLFNLCERGQRLYAEEKMNDLRAIKILSAIRTLSESSYDLIISMIENGESVSRKMLEKERDSLKAKLAASSVAPVDEKGELDEEPGSPEQKSAPLKKSESRQSRGGNGTVETVVKLPQIVFTYQRHLVELVYEELPAGRVKCRILGDPNQQVLELDVEDITFNNFVMPK